MVVHSSSTHGDSGGVDVLKLELLEGVGWEVSDVALEPSEWHSQAIQSEGGLEDGLIERLATVDDFLEVVDILVLLEGCVGSNDWPWLEGAISHDPEDIDHVMSQAVGLEVGGFLVVIHLKVTPTHLDHTTKN